MVFIQRYDLLKASPYLMPVIAYHQAVDCMTIHILKHAFVLRKRLRENPRQPRLAGVHCMCLLTLSYAVRFFL